MMKDSVSTSSLLFVGQGHGIGGLRLVSPGQTTLSVCVMLISTLLSMCGTHSYEHNGDFSLKITHFRRN